VEHVPMRSADNLRERWRKTIRSIMKRPAMFATTGREMEVLILQIMGDLCYLDNRDADYERACLSLHIYGSQGVCGPFQKVFNTTHCYAEVAAAYAEIFHQFGYLEVAEIPDLVWSKTFSNMRAWFDGRDLRRSEAQELLGVPSLVIDEGSVLCYAPIDPVAGWLFVDCPAQSTTRYQEGEFITSTDPDPLVRSLRHSGEPFEDGLTLTLYGKVLRWGPGWWIEHRPKP
jgi:hypothetical protein